MAFNQLYIANRNYADMCHQALTIFVVPVHDLLSPLGTHALNILGCKNLDDTNLIINEIYTCRVAGHVQNCPT